MTPKEKYKRAWSLVRRHGVYARHPRSLHPFFKIAERNYQERYWLDFSGWINDDRAEQYMDIIIRKEKHTKRKEHLDYSLEAILEREKQYTIEHKRRNDLLPKQERIQWRVNEK